MTNPERSRDLTINDIADGLEISKTTVSRAISGKGRVSAETRRRVMEYIEQQGYRPSGSTSRLLKSKTNVIGIVLPSDPNIIETPFFLGCLVGICETASFHGYSVMVATETNGSSDYINDMVDNHHVDGIILTRAFIDESSIKALQQRRIPFVVIGSSRDSSVVQVDNDVFVSCTELTKILLAGNERIALLAGDQSHRVQRVRYEGFVQAHIDVDRPVNKSLVFLNVNTRTVIEQAMSQIFEQGVDCIIANDDVICSRVLTWLSSKKYRIPHDVKVASFYNSNILAEHNPPITAISVNPKDVGISASKVLFRLLDGQPVKQKNLINYEILIRKSTM